MIEFAGRTAFVTGGANGVGIGLVRALLAEGCKVAIADIREEHIERAVQSFDNQLVMGIKVNVGDREEMARAADEVEARFGTVTLLFNNAGVNLFQSIEDSSYSDWDWLMGVNLHGPINGVMTFVPRMIAHGQGGYVVNTASMAGWLASGTPGIYNTTKFAVRGLSESLRYSLAPKGIGVSCVCPGLVKSLIYASDDVRPAELMDGAKPVNTEGVKQLAGMHQVGMEPDVIAARILQGMRENQAYIFPMPDHREELAEYFEEVLSDYRDYPQDPGFDERVKIEAFRRARYKEARDAARLAT
ncbi:SDR family NAD(P)-dependent oxidoreductase [Novosphingobium flavum]|uniref:SDR family NAD(P)-dependent oxidoreductase n=1 Tax=Novosphingobium aerophilum TaxID=2839843 RepID=A0A7X1F6X3_9SPHN|nr:SDR family NAD(P)-dependent oxidoreductase [Novosphingobium aerophilum]MBC2651164.1 SDR family NAD(P)-dependent oxidoreductase [Novosphingobium aerophilum]MBC2660721.1 SDR family NAD(P)-dependent oxidoreductase [Novosphingobium aerophilum]